MLPFTRASHFGHRFLTHSQVITLDISQVAGVGPLTTMVITDLAWTAYGVAGLKRLGSICAGGAVQASLGPSWGPDLSDLISRSYLRAQAA